MLDILNKQSGLCPVSEIDLTSQDQRQKHQEFRFQLKLSSDPDEEDFEGTTGVVDAEEKVAQPKLKKPSMYKVLLLNDDYTPMEFVVQILEDFFSMSREKATQVMLAVHTTGSGVAGIFPLDIAETKSQQVNEYSRENQHPLMSKVEMTD